MKIFKKTTVLLLLALIAASVVSCNKAKGGAEASGKPIEIRFGNLTYPEIILAQEKGFFEEELKPYNATVKVITFPSGPPQIEALGTQAVEFAALGDQPAVQAVASGVPVKIIAGISDATEYQGLVARAASGIKEVKDIKGHKIAAPAGTTAHQLLLVMLEKNGLTINDIEFVNMAIGGLTPSLTAGNVDGAVAWGTTFIDPPVNEGIVKISSAKGYKQIANVILARTEFVEQYPDVTAGVLRALQKAAKWRVDHYDETLEIVSNFLATDKDVFTKIFPTFVTLLKLDDKAKASVLESADLWFRSGLIDKQLTAEQLFDDTYSNAARLEVYPGWGAGK